MPHSSPLDPPAPPIRLTLLAIASVSVLACCPDLGGTASTCAGTSSNEATETDATLAVQSEPAAPLDAVPNVLRLHIAATDGQPLDPQRFVLVRGEVGSAHLSQLAREDISNALQERITPSINWVAEDGVLVLAPSSALAPDELYSVASGSPKFAQEIRTMADDPVPTAHRVWPPEGAAASAAMAVWCGLAGLAWHRTEAALAPQGPMGFVATGALSDEAGRQCVRFVATSAQGEAPGAGPWIGPPLFGDAAGAPLVRLEPRPITVDGPPVPLPPPGSCDADAGAVPVGPGCGWVQDDRIHVEGPDVALLWSVRGYGLDVVQPVGPGEHFLLAPLPVDSSIGLVVEVANTAGQTATFGFGAQTLPAMPHVVLNEVLANPLGAEPTQEWVELYNDGTVAAPLDGYVLSDVGGETSLPPAMLPPGSFALLVNEDYDEADELDPSPPAGVLLLRVPALGKSGLSNQGEPLVLRDEMGEAVSRFPALPKPKSGVSVMRTHPKALDELDSSFVRCPEAPTPGTANTAP